MGLADRRDSSRLSSPTALHHFPSLGARVLHVQWLQMAYHLVGPGQDSKNIAGQDEEEDRGLGVSSLPEDFIGRRDPASVPCSGLRGKWACHCPRVPVLAESKLAAKQVLAVAAQGTACIAAATVVPWRASEPPCPPHSLFSLSSGPAWGDPLGARFSRGSCSLMSPAPSRRFPLSREFPGDWPELSFSLPEMSVVTYSALPDLRWAPALGTTSRFG